MSAFQPTLSMSDKIFYFFDVLTQKVAGSIKQNPHNFIDIETTEDGHSISMSDGTLLTAISIEGNSTATLEKEFSHTVDLMEQRLGTLMNDRSHYVSFYFSADYEGIKDELKAMMEPSKLSLKRAGVNLDLMIDENISALSNYCHKERCLMLCWTCTKGLTIPERNAQNAEKAALRKGVPKGNDAQRIGVASPTLVKRHATFVERITKDFGDCGIRAVSLTAKELIQELRMSIEKEFTSYDWEPILSGDPINVRINEDAKPDCSGIMYPRLQEQIIPRATEEVGNDLYAVGSYTFAPMTISVMPKHPEPFWSLFKRMKQEQIPWQMHAMIKPNGMQVLTIKELLATFLQVTPGTEENKKIIDVRSNLSKFAVRGDVVTFQISMATWGPTNDINLVETRRARMVRAVQGWGSCEIAPAEGDAFETLASSCPGLMRNNMGEPAAAPLYDALKMMPLTRPASHWETGSMLMRSIDGKIMPYQPLSPLQSSWVTLINGPMGSGKSMFMNYYNLSLILSSKSDELPFLSIIDVGESSSGLIEIIRQKLPDGRKHLAVYKLLANRKDSGINVMDTRLGLRFPLTTQNDFLISFVGYLLQEDSSETLADGISGFAKALLSHAYKMCAERVTAKLYVKGVNPKIDALCKSLVKERGENTLWWDVVDHLFLEGEHFLASVAQRYAVPTVPDLAAYCSDSKVNSIYNDTLINGTPLPRYALRKLQEAINIYPIIAGVTQFDLGEARIVSLDLNNVAKGEDPASKRRVGLMYMVSYYALSNRFYFGASAIPEIPEAAGLWDVDYRPFHRAFVKVLEASDKRFCIDEKHRISGLTIVENQIDTSILEARKWLLEVVLCSQTPNHFTDDSILFATNKFILGGGSSEACDAVVKKFNLDESLTKHLYYSLKKPSKEGSTLIAMMEAGGNVWNSHPLMVTIGPTFLWACNSGRDDTIIRKSLYDAIGVDETLKLLKAYHPSGSIAEEVAFRKDAELRRLKQISKRGSTQEETAHIDGDDGTPTSILQAIIDDLLECFKEQRNALQRHRFSEEAMA